MSNTLPAALIARLYSNIDVVSREMVGFIPAVTHDPPLADDGTMRRAALNQTVSVPVTPARSAADSTPASTPPDTGDATQATASVNISKRRHVPIRYEGDEALSLMNGPGFEAILADDILQGMRTLANEIETDLGSLYSYASRAHGTAATTPFGTANNLTDSAGVARILERNGAKGQDLQLVLGPAAWANLRGVQSVLFKVNEAGSADMLRDGMTERLHGFALRHTSQESTHTAGTATGQDLDGATAVGDTTVTFDGSDAGTVLAGDVFDFTAFAGFGGYVVANDTHSLSGAAGGDVIFNAPGIREVIATTTEAVTKADYVANMAFARSAIVLVTRGHALPPGGDSAVAVSVIVDPVSGLAFEVAQYGEYLRSHWQVRISWGFAAIKPEHIALLVG